MSTTGSAFASAAASSYDEVPYPSSSFPQTHPTRLAAMAWLFGVAASTPSSSRVLELGCSDGGNLIPMAARMPNAKFLGIDASQKQIDAGRKVIAALQLTNLELRQQDIMEFSPAEGLFDYIIVHGVYSWVPAPVREKILAIAAVNLAPNGIAYVSYNALPGAGIRLMLRDLALFHARGIKDQNEKALRARELFRRLADPMLENQKPYSALFRREVEYVEGAPAFCLRHDLLEEENHALYFHEFVTAAAKHRLQYVGEPSLWEMLPAKLGPKARAALEKCEHWLDLEQELDFLRFRAFRQTLLCHATTPVRRQITAKAIKQFAIQPHFREPAEGVDLAPGVPARFILDDTSHFDASHPFTKAALQFISETPSQAIGYTKLVEEAWRRLPPSVQVLEDRVRNEITLMNDLMQLAAVGLIEIHAEPTGSLVKESPKPLASPFTRYQATNSDRVTNWVHEAVALDHLPRVVIAACDGNRSFDEIVSVILAAVADGRISVTDGGQSITAPQVLEDMLRPQISRIIADCTRLGLLA